MAVTSPDPFLVQRRAALEVANLGRTGPAHVKAQLALMSREDGAVEAARIIREQPEMVGSMPAHAFLDSVPGIGSSRVRRYLVRSKVWPLTRVRHLTLRERERLAACLTAPMELGVIDRAVLEAVGAGCVLAAEVGEAVGLDSRHLGSRLHSLLVRGFLVRVPSGFPRCAGWALSDAGVEVLRARGGVA